MTLPHRGEGIEFFPPSFHFLLWLIWKLQTHRDLISTVSNLCYSAYH